MAYGIPPEGYPLKIPSLTPEVMQEIKHAEPPKEVDMPLTMDLTVTNELAAMMIVMFMTQRQCFNLGPMTLKTLTSIMTHAMRQTDFLRKGNATSSHIHATIWEALANAQNSYDKNRPNLTIVHQLNPMKLPGNLTKKTHLLLIRAQAAKS